MSATRRTPYRLLRPEQATVQAVAEWLAKGQPDTDARHWWHSAGLIARYRLALGLVKVRRKVDMGRYSEGRLTDDY